MYLETKKWIDEIMDAIYQNHLKKLPTIRKWAKFTKMVSIFRGAYTGNNIEKWKN
jgi:hypothetical protein